MGRNFTEDLVGTELSLEQKLAIHLQNNHYPPVPLTMVETCAQAIDILQRAQWGDADANEKVALPEGVFWRNLPEAPAYAIVESHHLDLFIDWEE